MIPQIHPSSLQLATLISRVAKKIADRKEHLSIRLLAYSRYLKERRGGDWRNDQDFLVRDNGTSTFACRGSCLLPSGQFSLFLFLFLSEHRAAIVPPRASSDYFSKCHEGESFAENIPEPIDRRILNEKETKWIVAQTGFIFLKRFKINLYLRLFLFMLVSDVLNAVINPLRSRYRFRKIYDQRSQ